MKLTAANTPSATVSKSSSVLLQNLAAFVFGAVILYATALLPMEAVHNAAHDTRHTIAFPCH